MHLFTPCVYIQLTSVVVTQNNENHIARTYDYYTVHVLFLLLVPLLLLLILLLEWNLSRPSHTGDRVNCAFYRWFPVTDGLFFGHIFNSGCLHEDTCPPFIFATFKIYMHFECLLATTKISTNKLLGFLNCLSLLVNCLIFCFYAVRIFFNGHVKSILRVQVIRGSHYCYVACAFKIKNLNRKRKISPFCKFYVWTSQFAHIVHCETVLLLSSRQFEEINRQSAIFNPCRHHKHRNVWQNNPIIDWQLPLAVVLCTTLLMPHPLEIYSRTPSQYRCLVWRPRYAKSAEMMFGFWFGDSSVP